MPRALRVVRTGDASGADTVTMAEALADLAARVAAAAPSVVLVIWEKPGSDQVEMCSLPGSVALTQGLVLAASRAVFPDGIDE